MHLRANKSQFYYEEGYRILNVYNNVTVNVLPVRTTRLLMIQRTLNPGKADKYKVNRICKYNVKQRIEKLTG